MISRLALATAVTCLLISPAAGLADTGKTVTSTGTGSIPVQPTDRNNEVAIRAAVDAARKLAIPAALADARDRASSYAQAAGLTLGAVQSVSDTANASEYPPFAISGPVPGPVPGPFGPNTFCGIVHQPVFKRGHPRPVRFIVRRRCFVPPAAAVTLTVTYTAV